MHTDPLVEILLTNRTYVNVSVILWHHDLTRLFFVLVTLMCIPDVQWTSQTIVCHRYPVDINQLILKMVDDCYFTQLVNSSTRNENILDIIFTNRPSFINYCNVIPGISDHEAVLTSFMAQAVNYKESDHKLVEQS